MNILRHSALLIGSLMLTSGSIQAATFNLCAGTTITNVPSSDGTTSLAIPMWGYGTDTGGPCVATVPGPQLNVLPGDTELTINLRNTLPKPTSVMVPGLGLPTIGGTPEIFTDAQNRARVSSFVTPINANGGSGSYTWTNIRPGTYAYQSGTHVQVQVQMGLYGAVIQPEAANTAYPGIGYDQDKVLIYSAIDPVLHATVDNGQYGVGGTMTSTIDYKPKYFLVNGQSYSPDNVPDDAGPAGSTTLMRMINMDLDTHAPVLLGGYMDVVAESGFPYPYPRRQYSVNLAPGQTKDALVTLGSASNPAGKATLSLFDRRLNTTNAGGIGGGLVSQFSVSGTAAGTDPLYYFSLFAGINGTTGVGGVTVVPGLGAIENRDIVSYNPATGEWTKVLDGASLGLVRANNALVMANIDALHVFADGRMLISFDTPTFVPGIGGTGVVDDSDLVMYDPAAAVNPFSIAYTGTQLSLTSNAEDINALSVDVNGDLQVSTLGNVSIPASGNQPALSATRQDVLRFSQASRTWEIMFDGSDLTADFTKNAANIDALTHPDANQLLMSIVGNTSVAGIAVRDEDVLLYSGSFGLNNTQGLLETRLDMTAVINGLPGSADVSAMSWSNGMPYNNQAPVPATDSYAMDQRLTATLVVTAPGVLANDIDPDMNSLIVQPESITTTLGGTLDIAADGSFTYTPGATTGLNTLADSDSAIYTVIDGVGGTATGTVNIDVLTSAAPDNQPPVAVVDRVSTPKNTTLVIDVLANDTDDNDAIDPASVVITLQPKRGGTIDAINPTTGEVTYTPALNFTGTDVFKYKISDTGGLPSQSVRVRVNVTN
ncbi:Ig-like domain-containing protein [uncultured Amphritea sp.]|uniref:Ig-like domain-containing protein n=1 Tax=uncultured Amphritea sp. TaxID=981605 RepID=UPI00260790D1|nr:Ig-like domain-containing protein [uncultured Amphritea sp.]